MTGAVVRVAGAKSLEKENDDRTRVSMKVPKRDEREKERIAEAKLSNTEEGRCKAKLVLAQLIERQRLIVGTQPKPEVRTTKGRIID